MVKFCSTICLGFLPIVVSGQIKLTEVEHVRFSSPSKDSTFHSYKIRIANKGRKDMDVLIGGLSFGHYEACDINKYKEDGKFNFEKVLVPKKSAIIVYSEKTMFQSPPTLCGGVALNNRPQVLEAKPVE